MYLRELATIQTGLVLSRKQADIKWPESPYKYRAFTLSSFSQDGLRQDELVNFEAKEEVGDKYLSKSGDIIVRLSAPNYAILIGSETEGVLIPSQFLRVRVDGTKIIPGYLVIFLNSDEARRQIEKSSIGTVIKVLTVEEFKEIQIPISPLIEQERIIRLYELIKRQSDIKKKLSEAEQKRNKYYIEKLLKGESL